MLADTIACSKYLLRVRQWCSRDPGSAAVPAASEWEHASLRNASARRQSLRGFDPTSQRFQARRDGGYGGSGPAQLALALLADHLGDNEKPRVGNSDGSPGISAPAISGRRGRTAAF
ncbi:MAG: DUF6166 domain-containing protein [Verrucomicrobiia bacterium]